MTEAQWEERERRYQRKSAARQRERERWVQEQDRPDALRIRFETPNNYDLPGIWELRRRERIWQAEKRRRAWELKRLRHRSQHGPGIYAAMRQRLRRVQEGRHKPMHD